MIEDEWYRGRNIEFSFLLSKRHLEKLVSQITNTHRFHYTEYKV